MIFIVSSQALAKGLQIASGALSNNSPLPILSYFLFDLDKTNLEICASDLETTMLTRIEVESKDKGKVAVPAKLLLDTIKTFGDEPLTFNLNKQTYMIEVSSLRGKFKVAAMNGEEFPKIPAVEKANFVDLPSTVVSEAIEHTLFATANDDLRQVMNGVFCEMSPEGITFVATDAHRLVRYKRKDARSQANVTFIMAKKPLNLLKSSLPQNDSQVHIEYNEANAFFTFAESKLICRLIEGKYPNYEAVIPKEAPNEVIVNRALLLSSLRRVSIFSSKTTHQVRLKIEGSQLTINAEDIDFNNEASEVLSCNYSGADMEIAFNSRFLIELINNMPSEDVLIKLSLPNRAGLFIPASQGTDSQEDLLMLLMPVMIS